MATVSVIIPTNLQLINKCAQKARLHRYGVRMYNGLGFTYYRKNNYESGYFHHFPYHTCSFVFLNRRSTS